ncbi:hypothetical protein HYALB_00006427 [Hymenoscyphus albidus]|uniref:Amidase domain-containing protein n=1 Tax=Hymenoscyphus albidus TaxID=595503 RepID=A0A9N9LLH0_9HELO|nr:hypothetical protein HYALB_00006427 [Hymenoscyphus albidus]
MWNVLDVSILTPGLYGRLKFANYYASKDLDPSPFSIVEPCLGESYIPMISDGMPCALQISALRLEDEKCLHAAQIIEELLKKDEALAG